MRFFKKRIFECAFDKRIFPKARFGLEMHFVSRMLVSTQVYQVRPKNALFNSTFLVLDLNFVMLEST